MDNEKLDYFKNLLLQKRNAIEDIVQRNGDYSREKDDDARDLTDMAVESYTKDFLAGKSAGDRRMLQDIDDALARIDNRTYGFCVNCDDEISPRRLQAVPWAAMCIKCQELLEKGKLKQNLKQKI
jgi:DnaK suppressor protein